MAKKQQRESKKAGGQQQATQGHNVTLTAAQLQRLRREMDRLKAVIDAHARLLN